MKKDPDHNSTDSAEIEALITRIKRGQLRDGDAQLLARLLRLLLRLITLPQHKIASLWFWCNFSRGGRLSLFQLLLTRQALLPILAGSWLPDRRSPMCRTVFF